MILEHKEIVRIYRTFHTLVPTTFFYNISKAMINRHGSVGCKAIVAAGIDDWVMMTVNVVIFICESALLYCKQMDPSLTSNAGAVLAIKSTLK